MNIFEVVNLLCMLILLPGLFITSAYLYRNYRKCRENHVLHNLFFDTLSLGIVEIDRKGRIIFENRKSQEILGCMFHEIEGIDHKELKNFTTINEKKLKFIDSSLNRHGILKQIIAKEGRTINLLIDVLQQGESTIYIFAEAGKGQAFENVQLQTETILNSITSILFVINRTGNIVMGNKALSRFLEMDLKDILGMNIKELAQAFRFSPLDLFIHEPYDEIEPQEVSITTIKGNSKNILMYQSPIKSPEGEVIGYTAVGTDITQIKEEQYKLMQSEKLITLGQMAAGIVHEIRNPLTAIKGFSQIIQKLTNDMKVLECARLIDSETNNMNKVVTDFLKFARPSPPVLKEVRIRDLLESMRLIIESNAFIRKINLHFQYNKEDISVFVDDDQLRQVILNLAQNAMDAMNNTTEPQLSIVSGYNKSTRQVYIAVSDNGKGMTYDERLRAGTPFFTTKDRGTGLGLSVCMQIIREHGGHLKIDSTPGEGTTATIFLVPAVKKEKSSIA